MTLKDILSIVTLFCVPLILTVVFYHFHFKKYKVLTQINNYMLFKKYLFNKGKPVYVGNKIIVSFYYLTSFCITLITLFWVRELMFTTKVEPINPEKILEPFLFALIAFIVTRLIYEFILIPYLHNKKIQQYQLQQSNQHSNNEQSFQFCSQCGTRYNITDEICSNCGEK